MTEREQKQLAKVLLMLYEIINDAIDKVSVDGREQSPLLTDLQEARQLVLRIWQDFDLTVNLAGPGLGE